MLEKVIYDLNPYNELIQPKIEMRVEFPREYENFVPAARREQGKAIVYLQYLAAAEATVGKMDRQRTDEASPRWQANYDLLRAHLVAYQARVYEYGATLTAFVKNPEVVPLTKLPNLTLVDWNITTRRETLTQESKPYIERSLALYETVIQNHPGTPWAKLAQQEIDRGFGVKFYPEYDPPYPQFTGKLIPIPNL